MMGPAWRVEYPLDVSLKKEITDVFLVPFFERAVKFAFSSYKITAVVRSYQCWRPSSSNKSPETVLKRISVQSGCDDSCAQL